MRKIPIHPVIQLQVAQLLRREFRMSAEAAIRTSTRLITLFRENNLDIVKGDWMADPLVAKTGFRWEDLPRIAAELDDSPMAPWNARELK